MPGACNIAGAMWQSEAFWDVLRNTNWCNFEQSLRGSGVRVTGMHPSISVDPHSRVHTHLPPTRFDKPCCRAITSPSEPLCALFSASLIGAGTTGAAGTAGGGGCTEPG
jgi:hypothetical protein